MIAFSEANAVRSIVKENFYDFVKEFWETVVPEPFIYNWHIPLVCKELQIVAERVFKRQPKAYDLIINVSPGSTKSKVCTVLFPAWVWTRMTHAGIISTSYTDDVAMELSRLTRQVIRSDKYAECFPEIEIRKDVDAKGLYGNTKGGERKSVGTGGMITGRHADFIIIDDPLNPKGARSDVELAAAESFIKETLWSRKKDKAVTPTILIMQRLHQSDPTQVLMDLAKEAETKIRHICLPAIKTENIRPKEWAKFYKDGLFDPVRLSSSVLKEARAQGTFAWSGQYLQSPVPLGGGMFKTQHIRVEEMPPERKFVKLVRYWDKAGTKDDGDFTVGLKMGKDVNQRFWILDVKRGQWGTDEREAIIKSAAQIDGRNVVIGIEEEPGSSGKDSARATVKNLAGFRVVTDKPSGDKTLRADPLSVQVNSGNVSMVRADWNSVLTGEMDFFPYSKNDDQVDAASGAFKILNPMKPKVGVWGRKGKQRWA